MEEQDDGPKQVALLEVGRRVRERREFVGLSQKALALLVGCQENSVSRWETGKQQMGIVDMLAVAKHLGTSVQALMDPSSDPTAVRPAPVWFISPLQLRRLQAATTRDELLGLLPGYPPVGLRLDPEDVQVTHEQFKKTQRDANALFDEKSRNRLTRSITALLRSFRAT
jgi:transcriptional regulator with XRE-family HTH domain